MLHRANWPDTSEQHNGSSSGGREFISYAQIISFLRQNLWIIAISLLLGIAGASTYIVVVEPLFTARAQLLIEPKTAPLLRDHSGEMYFSLDSAQVESQVAILKSHKIISTVIANLALDADPDFQTADNSLVGMILASIRSEDDAPPSPADRFRRAREKIESGLDVRRFGLSYAVEISFIWKDPEKAASVANAVAEAYVRDQIETKSQAARHGGDWLEGRITELRAEMNAATQRAQEFKLTHDYRVARRSANGTGSDQTRLNGDEAKGARAQNTLEELETTAETYRKMYETSLQAFTEATSRQSYPVSYARVITPATRPANKSHPRSTLVLAFGVLVGLLSGFGISLVRVSLDDSVRSSRQIRDLLGLECLGEIPRLRNNDMDILLRMTSGTDPDGHFDEIARAPMSPFTSSLQKVKACLKFANGDRPVRCIGITSALPREGKSTIASNLATLFSMSGSRILVIDADLYSSTLSKKLAPASTGGLIQALREPAIVKQQIISPKDAGFDLLPAIADPIVNSSDILASEYMQILLESLCESYDLIILDLPPMKPMVDGLVISALLDGVILVVEWGQTPVELVAEIARSLHMAKASVLGIVMTKVDAGPAKPYYGYSGVYNTYEG